MVIFDCADFQVVGRDGSAFPHIVTFSSLGMFTGDASHADGETFWAKSLAEKLDLSAVGFIAKQRNWFCSPAMQDACALVARRWRNVPYVVAYGSSMGAYAALRWGGRCGAASVVAFSPQHSLDPAIVSGFDRRYQCWFRPDLHRGMEITQSDVTCAAYVFFDPTFDPDRQHVALLRTAADSIVPIPLPYCGHECVRVFADSQIAARLLRASLSGQPGRVEQLAREARRRAPIRVVELTTRLAARKPKLASRLYRRFPQAFEKAHRNTVLSVPGFSAALQSGTPFATGAGSNAPPILRDDTKGRKPVETSSNAERIVHVHVPKTAGTALRTAFEKQFRGRLRVFPHWDEAKYQNVDPSQFDFFSGHIGFNTAKRLGGKLVTVLRHPIDRFISVYFFWRELYEKGIERSLNTELAAKYDLSEFVKIRDQPHLLEEFHNRCTFQLAYGSALTQRRDLRQKGLTEDQIFALAIDNVASFSVIGVQEDMAGLSRRIKDVLNVDLGVQKVNVTESRLNVSEISISTRHAMHDWVYMDLELYAHVLRL